MHRPTCKIVTAKTKKKVVIAPNCTLVAYIEFINIL